jgi:predicted nucleic acid-binding protein
VTTAVVDTNVVLDVLLDREPHAEHSERVFAAASRGAIRGLLGATTLATVHCIAARDVGERKARTYIEHLLSLFGVAPVTADVLQGALTLNLPDYEDAVLHEAGRRAGATAIITRDRAGFAKGRLTVYTPSEVIALVRTRRKKSHG